MEDLRSEFYRILDTNTTPRHMIGTSSREVGESSNPPPPSSPPSPPPSPSQSQSKSPATFETMTSLLESMKVKRVEENKFMTNGPSLPVGIWENEGEGMVRVRIDMPGMNSLLVYPDPDENSINFKGLEEEITMHGIDDAGVCRSYEGSLHFDRDRFPGLDFDYEIGNGVVLFKIFCLIPATSAEELGVLLMTNQESEEEGMKESAHNPLVTTGRDRHCIQGFKDEGFVFGVDTPGLGEEDQVIIHVLGSGTMINFFAEEKDPRPYGESQDEKRRGYEGIFKVDPTEFNAKEAQFEIVHGVLWIQIPRTVKMITQDPIVIVPPY